MFLYLMDDHVMPKHDFGIHMPHSGNAEPRQERGCFFDRFLLRKRHLLRPGIGWIDVAGIGLLSGRRVLKDVAREIVAGLLHGLYAADGFAVLPEHDVQIVLFPDFIDVKRLVAVDFAFRLCVVISVDIVLQRSLEIIQLIRIGLAFDRLLRVFHTTGIVFARKRILRLLAKRRAFGKHINPRKNLFL